MIPAFVSAEVTIIRQHTERAWFAALPNGKEIIAFRDIDEPTLSLSAGDRVPVELNVADFSQAHLLG